MLCGLRVVTGISGPAVRRSSKEGVREAFQLGIKKIGEAGCPDTVSLESSQESQPLYSSSDSFESMTDQESDRRYVESRCCLEEKLKAIEQKLDHIIYRLSEEDPRIYRPKEPDVGSGDCEEDNGEARLEPYGRD